MSRIDNYIELAVAWEDAMIKCKSKKANKLHDMIERIYLEIITHNEQAELFSKIDHSQSDGVLFFIASHIKVVDSVKARDIYTRLKASEHAFISISSIYILKEWQERSNT